MARPRIRTRRNSQDNGRDGACVAGASCVGVSMLVRKICTCLCVFVCELVYIFMLCVTCFTRPLPKTPYENKTKKK